MFRVKEVQDKLLHLIGWRQDYNPAIAISEDLTESESGLYFQDAHPMMTLANLRAIVPDDFSMQYPEWNIVTPYHKGQKVKHKNIVWLAKADNVGAEPPYSDFNNDYSQDFGGEFWQPYNFFSDYLKLITRVGISSSLLKFQQDKELRQETRTLLERKTLFDGAGRINATLANKGRLVGMEIMPIRSMGVTTKIEKIGLQMTGGVGIVKMYLFHSSQKEPIKTIELNFTKTNGGFQWFDVKDVYLPYISDGNDAGGSWYLVYNQNELPEGMTAINVSKDWSREPCGTCNIGSVETWRAITKYMQISPFFQKAPTTFDQYPEMWDVRYSTYTNTHNYGINLEVSVGCDLTDFIIEQRHIFAEVIQKEVTANALRTMAMNPDVRVNRNQSNASKILYELDGDKPGTGMMAELDKAYKALRISTLGLDRICLACEKTGIKFKSI